VLRIPATCSIRSRSLIAIAGTVDDAAQTARNDRAVDLFLGYSDCVKRVIDQTC
jgi:hypothetical protein